MPSYDYVCDNCGHRFEEFQPMSADPLKDCPACNNASLRRLIGGGLGVIFKGSGFYVNDSKKSSGGGSGKAGKSGASETAASATKTADTTTTTTPPAASEKAPASPAKGEV
ncbi:MAG: zinc ribbon domain-containing protein [Spirochaetales bacterium]|nr:zinc ribbon domain-containing protein [Spirochaetales bacterium]